MPSLRSTCRTPRRGFTLIEVIVVFLIIAILASIAAVAYTSTISNAQTRAAQAELDQFSTAARAMAILDGQGYFSAADVTAAVTDSEAAARPHGTGSAAVLAAAGFTVSVDPAAHSTSSTNVAALISDDGQSLYMSMVVPGHGCAFSNASLAGAKDVWGQGDLRAPDCTGANAALGKATHITPLPAQPPTAPAGLAAALTHTEGQIDLTWDAVDEATSYTVLTSANGSTWSTAASNLTSTSYSDTAAPFGVKTYFEVTANNAVGPSTPSAAVSATAVHYGYISTYAGGGATYAENVLATNTLLKNPTDVAVDAAGDVYVAESSGYLIRRIDAVTGVITAVAGDQHCGWNPAQDGGPATAADICVSALTVDGHGNVFFSDSTNSVIREVTTDGKIHTVAGNGITGWNGDGTATASELRSPLGLTVGPDGDLYVADMSNNRVRKIDLVANTITTIIGTGRSALAGDGLPAGSASVAVWFPADVAFDPAGHLYIVDSENSRIREVNSAGIITTVAGTTKGFNGDGGAATLAQMYYPRSIAFDKVGNYYIADSTNSRVRRVDAATGIMTTIAGDSTAGYIAAEDNGPATSASLRAPQGVAIDAAGHLYIADTTNNRIRTLTMAP